MPLLDHDLILHCFTQYIAFENRRISRSEFINNLEAKLLNNDFRNDVLPLLPVLMHLMIQMKHIAMCANI